MHIIIETREQALRAIERAPWNANNNALTGAAIWGEHGQFARERVTTEYTYDLARDVIERYDWART